MSITMTMKLWQTQWLPATLNHFDLQTGGYPLSMLVPTNVKSGDDCFNLLA